MKQDGICRPKPYGCSESLFPAWGSSGSRRPWKASRSPKWTVGAHRFSVWASSANMLQLNTQRALVPPHPVLNRDGNRGLMSSHQLSLALKTSWNAQSVFTCQISVKVDLEELKLNTSKRENCMCLSDILHVCIWQMLSNEFDLHLF